MQLLLTFVLLGFSASALAADAEPSPPHEGRLSATIDVENEDLKSILKEARASHRAWERLADLCDNIGARLAGSAALEQAVEWSVGQLKGSGADKVWTEDVQVPHWERGHESAFMTAPRQQAMNVLGLGGTVAGE